MSTGRARWQGRQASKRFPVCWCAHPCLHARQDEPGTSKAGPAPGGAGASTDHSLFCPKSEDGLSARWPRRRLFEGVSSHRGSMPVNESYARPGRWGGAADSDPRKAGRRIPFRSCLPSRRSSACVRRGRPPRALAKTLRGRASSSVPWPPGGGFILARRDARRCHRSRRHRPRRLRFPRCQGLQAQGNAHPGRRSAPSMPPATRCCR